MIDYRHAVLIILVMGIVTLATRILPVFIFGRNEKVPDFVLYLGRVVPYTAMGLLIVYCLKDVSFLSCAAGDHFAGSCQRHISREAKYHPQRRDRDHRVYGACPGSFLKSDNAAASSKAGSMISGEAGEKNIREDKV